MSDGPDVHGTDESTEAPPEPDQVEDLRLQSDGDEHGRAEWEAAAAAVLRKAGRLGESDADADVWRVLTRRTLDGIEVAPLGTPALLDGLDTSARPTRSGPWDVRAHAVLGGPRGADARTVNQELLADLAGGATSVWLTIAGNASAEDLADALHDVHLDLAPAVIETLAGEPRDHARALLEVLGERTPAPGTNLGVDPLAALLADGEPAGSDTIDDVVVEAAAMARETGTLALVVDATVAHDLGASDAQELGWSMAAGVACLRALDTAGIAVDDAAALIEFRYAATDEQFPTIAKLRAARRLWARVIDASGGTAGVQRQHAVTSRPMMSRFDAHTNMLRGTVEAFAAGVGGADAVTVLPFDATLGRPEALGRRVARNTSHLLIQESHVANVTDPAGGSYAVEKLTDDLARAGWAELGRIEGDGGAAAGIAGLRSRIAEVAARRDELVATRRRAITGLSEFPDLAETPPAREGAGDDTRRYGAAFEAMRAEPAQQPAFLATLGPVAAHTARATFAANLLAAGGVAVETAGATAGPDDLVAAYRGQRVVVLAGSDATYAEWGADAARALREAGAAYVVLAGTPGERTVPDDLVDDSCAMGVQAIDFLTRVREETAR